MPICTRCGEEKPIGEFSKHTTAGRLTFCKDCRKKGVGIYLLDNPEHLTARTFWSLWRKLALAPIVKYLLVIPKNALERQMVEEILRDVDEKIVELSKYIIIRLKKIQYWRSYNLEFSPDKQRAEECHKILDVPWPMPNGDYGKVLRRAFRAKARVLHPDLHNGMEEEFKVVQDAYDFLVGYYKRRKDGESTKGTVAVPAEGRGNNCGQDS